MEGFAINSRLKILFLLLISAVLFQCNDDPVITKSDNTITPDIVVSSLDELIVIKYNQTVLIKEEKLFIKFEKVEEGRCPIDVYCFWEGQATGSFQLTKLNEGRATAKPVIRPSVRPGTKEYWNLAGDALGYRLFLEELNPYPDIDKPFDPRNYIAQLRVEKISACCGRDEVCFTWKPPARLQKDSVILHHVELREDILTITAAFGGGCGDHEFRLFMQPAFMKSMPVQANLYFQHTDLGDPCDAIISEDISFNIRKIADLYRDMFGSYSEITLNVYGYFTDQPDNQITISYKPE